MADQDEIGCCLASNKKIERQKMMARMRTDINDIQVNKYYNLICTYLERNDFTNARINTELLTYFMERINYDQMPNILEEVYKFFGAHQLLVFQDIEEWDEQANHNRRMFFLGQYFEEETYELDISLYGYDIVHGK